MREPRCQGGDCVIDLRSRGFEVRPGESVEDHYARAQRIGWRGPPDALELLFGVSRGAVDVGRRHPGLDWSAVQWVERSLSVAEVEALHIERQARARVDEMRRRVCAGGEEGLDARRMDLGVSAVGMVRPVVLAGELMGSPGTHELVAGFSVVGQWLGAADRATASGAALLERLANDPASLLYKPLSAVPPALRLRVWAGS